MGGWAASRVLCRVSRPTGPQLRSWSFQAAMEVTQFDLFYRFGVAVLIGLLIGLEREHSFQRVTGETSGELFAGARTFALFGLVGCTAALITDLLDEPLAFGAAVLVVGAFLAIAYSQRVGEGAGLTTETAALVTVFIGALAYWEYLGLAAALGVGTAVLLAVKVQTQSLARTMDQEDVYATLKFAFITVIILPILPRQGYGPAPFDVLEPFNVWLMVVLISGISFLGYVMIKLIGAERGVGLTGLLGGLASSTAVTLSFSERSRRTEQLAQPFAMAIVLAWTVMFVRILVEVAVVNPTLLPVVWLPVVVAMASGVGYCVYLYTRQEPRRQREPDTFQNPFELGPAITFGLLYAVILVAANAAQMYFGDAGIYISSIAGGTAGVDAVVLSMAELSRGGEEALDMQTATRAILMAAAANTAVKGGIVMASGSASLRRVILPGLLLVLATTIGVIFLV